MKKTIITLLLAATCAMGADWQYQSAGVVSGGTAKTDGGTYNGVTFTIKDDSDRSVWMSSESDDLQYLALTLNSIAVSGKAGDTSFSYSVGEGESAVTKHLSMIVVDATGALVATSTGASTQSIKPINGIDYTRNYGVFSFTDVEVLANTQYFAYFVTQENMEVIKATENFTLSSSNFNLTTTVSLLAFKSSDSSDFSYKSPAEDLAFSSGFGTERDTAWIPAVQVKGTCSVIPEPTTATLSLLALAGLAARRRRK